VRWQDHISIDPDVLVGKPVVTGTRIAVELIIDLLGRGYTVEQVLQQYAPPHCRRRPGVPGVRCRGAPVREGLRVALSGSVAMRILADENVPGRVVGMGLATIPRGIGQVKVDAPL
jgi:hypothetical protein